jgi:hypothetical protein
LKSREVLAAAKAPTAARNEITDGAVVAGGVVQAGTITGRINFHYEGTRAPLALLNAPHLPYRSAQC